MDTLTVGKCSMELARGDITRESCAAIVNAANKTLLGGGGVDGAIHRAGGPAILDACRKLNGCETGDAKITTGGNLEAKYVIHTVGPVWNGGTRNEAAKLASCYRRSLEIAVENDCESVAFPAISTGVYGYPIVQAAEVALGTVCEFLTETGHPQTVRFILFSESDLEVYRAALATLASKIKDS